MPLRYALGGFAWRGVRIAIRAALALGVAAALAPVALVVLGFHPTLLRTDALQPGMDEGDIVINEVVAQSAVRAGDIVTYTEATTSEAVTERVVEVHQDDDAFVFTTSGATRELPVWSPPSNEQITRVAYRVPALDDAVDQATLASTRVELVPAGLAILGLAILLRAVAAIRSRRALARFW
jgi:signal peptidase I